MVLTYFVVYSRVTTPLLRAVYRPRCLNCVSMEFGNCFTSPGARLKVKVSLSPSLVQSISKYFMNYSFISSLMRLVKARLTPLLDFLLIWLVQVVFVLYALDWSPKLPLLSCFGQTESFVAAKSS
jgi:hypothetical protein